MALFYFFGAILFICAAHYIRVRRWQLFIEIYEKPNIKSLIQALSLGYLLSYIIPFKLGDVFRAWYAGKKMRNGKVLGISTVIIDRYLDILAVGIVFVALSLGNIGGEEIRETSFFYIIVAGVLFLVTGIIYRERKLLKKVLHRFASIFNKKIETVILKIAWALIWNFKDIFFKINKSKLIVSTLGMWGLYLISYFFLGEFFSSIEGKTSWIDFFSAFFAQNGIMKSTLGLFFLRDGQDNVGVFFMILYIIGTIVLMLGISFFLKNEDVEENQENEYLNLFPHLDSRERLKFLENYFLNVNSEYIDKYLKINQGISIIRDYSAGSKATTMLCVDRENTFFRKYAFGLEGEKLYQQIRWIEENKNILKLPEVVRKERNDFYCYYDMLYNSGSMGMFEYVHSMPIDKGWEIIKDVIEDLEGTLYKVDVRKAEKEIIRSYVESKVRRNIKKIKEARKIRALQQYETLIINGVKYKNLVYYEKYLEEEYLEKIFEQDFYAVIHGDLTIENIICSRSQSGQDYYYLIDPNTGNIHESPNLDYGKLLQSIHGGYEFLMSLQDVKINHNKISFLFTKSSVYIELYKRLHEYLTEKFGYERTRSIYFHEIIHWLRLMPYKIEKDENKAVLFYAGMLMVMNDVIAMFEDKSKVRDNEK